MDQEDYESLPTNNVSIHMVAGAIAGILEHCLMFPVDSVKTRMQSLSPVPDAHYTSVKDGLIKMVKQEGSLRTLRGMNAVIIGAGPAHALYFSAYEGIRSKLKSNHPIYSHLGNAAAGCGATILHDAVMVPSEALKQRMQMHNSPYKSCTDCMCKMYCKEGANAFYRSFTTQMFMNIPFHATHIMIYEKCSEMFNPSREHNPKVHMMAGALGGAIAAAATTPLDVCKTLLNTQETSSLKHVKKKKVIGVISALRTIHQLKGWKGYFIGMQARIIFQIPGTAIAWSVYELFKHKLIDREQKHSSKLRETETLESISMACRPQNSDFTNERKFSQYPDRTLPMSP